MDDERSTTYWIDLLKAGDERAAQQIWQRYFDTLVRFAHRKLGELPRRAADEEDVALSAFDSFCRGAAEGKFPQLDDRDDLWKVLVVITARKALAYRKHAFRKKRGGGEVRGESVFHRAGADQEEPGLAQVIGQSPTPDFAAEVAEQYEQLLAVLPDDLRTVAQAKLEGYSNAEIATRLGRSERAVERKLQGIRKHWAACVVNAE